MIGRKEIVVLTLSLCLVLPSKAQLSIFTEYIVSSGFRNRDDQPTSGRYYMANREGCALLCSFDDLCVTAFFSKAQQLCLTSSNYSQPWIAKSDWDALINASSISTQMTTVYARMPGSVYGTTGSPAARRRPYGLAANVDHCQLICDSASPTCNMFAYSSTTRQCILFDLAATALSAPTDASLNSYYRFTTTNYSTASAYSYSLLATDVTSVSWITFSVMACSDAHLTLQPSNSATVSTNAYEFAIGGWSNSQTCFRRVLQGTTLACAAGAFLNCNSPRQLWISWTGGLIRFGTGSVVGESVAISYSDASPYPVKAIGLSGWSGAPGSWSVNIPLWT